MKATSPKKHSELRKCRLCGGSQFHNWLDLGNQPLANALLSSPDQEEKRYPLNVCYCLNCSLVQLDHVVDPKELFTEYLYRSSTSEVFRSHFVHLAEKEANLDNVKKGDLVVDIGSNDGILLEPFKRKCEYVLGIEPNKEIARTAVKKGIDTISEYFTIEVAKGILEDYGKPKLVTMTNVLAHVDDIDSVLKGVKILIGDWGRFMVEVPYLPDMVKKGTFDLVYHEHLSYFTLQTLSQLFGNHGLIILEAEFVPVHGGSIRVYAGALNNSVVNSGFIRKQIEKDRKFMKSREFHVFPDRVARHKGELTRKLARLKDEGSKIIGYGAPAKLSTITNYYNFPDGTFDYIIDDAPEKQGKYTPGKHMKIVAPHDDLKYCTHRYMMIFAWNFATSIMKTVKEKGFRGKFIVPFPTVRVYE